MQALGSNLNEGLAIVGVGFRGQVPSGADGKREPVGAGPPCRPRGWYLGS